MPALAPPPLAKGIDVSVDRLNKAALAQQMLDPDLAEPMARHALELACANGDKKGEAHALLNITLFEARFGSETLAERLLPEVAVLMQEHADDEGGWLTEHARALVLCRQGRYEEVLASQQLLEIVSSAERGPEHRFRSLTMQALTHRALGHSMQALQCGYHALSCAQQSGSAPLHALALNNLSSLHFDQDNLEDARKLAEQALAFAVEEDSRFVVFFSALNACFCYCAMGLPHLALQMIEQHLREAARRPWTNIFPRQHIIALGCLENGRLEDAEWYLRSEAPRFGVNGSKAQERAWVEAGLRIAQERFDDARDICTRALEIGGEAASSTRPYDRMKLCDAMSRTSEALGDLPAAVTYLHRACEAREEVADRATRARYIALQIEQEVIRARHENELALAQERQRIMREIDDGVGVSLITSLAMIERGKLDAAGTAGVLRDCIDELKLTVDSLAPINGNLMTLIATFRHRLEWRLEASGTRMRWTMRELPALEWLDAKQSLSILRILQEALMNVVSHARASYVDVATEEQPQAGIAGVLISIVDNGLGFDLSEREGHGSGLLKMRERASALGGRLSIDSAPGHTAVDLWLPLQRGAQRADGNNTA